MWHLEQHQFIVILLLLCGGILLCITPCHAGERYFSGGPELFVSLDSTNELIPGTTMVLPLVLENKGKVTIEFYNSYTIQPDYIPTTALFATIMLVPGDAPVKIKTNPMAIGDIPAGSVVPAEFIVEIPEDAKSGNYTMNALVSYQYVPREEQQTTDTIQYFFKDEKTVLPVPVTIRPMLVLSVDNSSSTGLHAGGEGYVTFQIRNTGEDTGKHTSLYLTPDAGSPIIPYSDGIYLGTLAPGDTVNPRFKVSVSENADPNQFYPLTMYAVYKDKDGNTVQSAPVSTGVTFSDKVEFERTSQPSVLHPGETGLVTVTYRNSGKTPVFNAQARISVVAPFSSDDATAFLGDMRSGESIPASFSVKVDKGATIKTYSVNSEIQYTNIDNTAFVSQNIPVIIDVQEDSGSWLYLLLTGIIIVAGAGYLWYRRSKNN